MAEFVPVNSEISRRLAAAMHRSLIHVCVPRFRKPTETKRLVMFEKYERFYEDIKKMEVFEDDVWVVTLPRCGTTWTQEMVWLLSNGMDFEAAKRDKLSDRFPFLEESALALLAPDTSVEKVKNMPRPRFIKTHVSAEFLPDQIWEKKPKIIYTARNPKDAAVSYYHFTRHVSGYKESKELFMDAFLTDQVVNAPFFEHILDFWDLRREPNVLFLTYESMKRDLGGVIRETAEFLGKTYADSQNRELNEHLSVDSMKKNEAVNKEDMINLVTKQNNMERDEGFGFIRKGVVGSYKEDLSPEYIRRFDDWTQQQLANTDFRFSED